MCCLGSVINDDDVYDDDMWPNYERILMILVGEVERYPNNNRLKFAGEPDSLGSHWLFVTILPMWADMGTETVILQPITYFSKIQTDSNDVWKGVAFWHNGHNE